MKAPLFIAALALSSCAGTNDTAEVVAAYKTELARSSARGDEAAVARFAAFLQRIGDPDYIRENTAKVYAADAYLNDTLVTKRGAGEIETYFLETSETMTSYAVTIDDVARSGRDWYVRWTLVFSAPALAGGGEVHSIGISQVRFDKSGKVATHQDFWDSGRNLFGQAPVVGGMIGVVRGRLE